MASIKEQANLGRNCPCGKCANEIMSLVKGLTTDHYDGSRSHFASSHNCTNNTNSCKKAQESTTRQGTNANHSFYTLNYIGSSKQTTQNTCSHTANYACLCLLTPTYTYVSPTPMPFYRILFYHTLNYTGSSKQTSQEPGTNGVPTPAYPDLSLPMPTCTYASPTPTISYYLRVGDLAISAAPPQFQRTWHFREAGDLAFRAAPLAIYYTLCYKNHPPTCQTTNPLHHNLPLYLPAPQTLPNNDTSYRRCKTTPHPRGEKESAHGRPGLRADGPHHGNQ